MQIVSRAAQAMQAVFCEVAEEVGRATGVIRRQRKFSAATLAQTLTFGFLAKPRATWDQLALAAARCGVDVSPQAIEQRFKPVLVNFLEQLVLAMSGHLVAAEPVMCELLRRFNGVFLSDSTIVRLPDAYATQWPGCGGSQGFGLAGLKIQLRLDWLTGAIGALQFEAARDPDQKTSLQHKGYPPGALRIADLGYFCSKTLGDLAAQGVYYLSRLQFGTTVYDAAGKPRQLMQWLGELWQGEALDLNVLLGKEWRLPCRLLASRVPAAVAEKRRRRLREDCRRKGRTPSDERLACCGWTIYVTNVEAERLSWNECVVLYRTRWQIELIFKLWKSEGQLAVSTPGPAHRQMATLLARLLAMILQHWLLLSSVWHMPERSLRKAAQRIRDVALCLAGCLRQPARLIEELTTLRTIVQRVARVNKRRQKPNHHQLLDNPDLINYSLT